MKQLTMLVSPLRRNPESDQALRATYLLVLVAVGFAPVPRAFYHQQDVPARFNA